MKSALRNFNLYKSFECAARHQSYSKAAVELYISQAAVSQQMRQLEDVIGSKLFLRKNKQMLLTPKGVNLFEATKQALAILQKSINEIKNEGVAGSLTITSTQAFTSLWLMPKLYKFSRLHPEIEIRVMSSSSFDDLKQQHIDLAIRFGINVKERTDSSFTCEYFGEDPVYPVCSVQLASSHSFKEPIDLLKSWLVSLENPGNYDWASWFESVGIKEYQKHQQWTKVHSTDMALNAVLNGHGFTLAARYLCIQQLNLGQLVMPVNISHPNTVKRYLVFDADSARIARIKVFTRWLKKEMESD